MMASTGRGGVGFLERFYVPETPRFFKVMIQEFLDRGKVAIPRKFIRKYGNYLSNRVLLKAPSGESFEVALEVFEGRVWLGNGWRKFQEYYSLVMGSFILFELEGNDALNVLIFDLSGTEIDYVVEDSYQLVETEQTGDSSPVESTEDSEPEPKGRQFKGRSRHKPTDLQSESESSGLRKRTSRPKKRANISHTTRSLAGRKPRIVKEPLPLSSNIALEAAKRYRAEFPAFRVRLRPSYMRSGGVSISSKFMKKNKLEPGESLVKLKHRGQSWTVKMFCYQDEYRGKLCSGWGVFLEDNHLHNGDVCVFELIQKNMFNVCFFRCSSYS